MKKTQTNQTQKNDEPDSLLSPYTICLLKGTLSDKVLRGIN